MWRCMAAFAWKKRGFISFNKHEAKAGRGDIVIAQPDFASHLQEVIQDLVFVKAREGWRWT